MRAIIALCGLLLLQVPEFANTEAVLIEPECKIVPKFNFYDVSGKSADEITSAMLKLGPIDEAGKRRFAHAEWHVDWKWKTRPNGSVDLSTLTLRCRGEIAIPRLKEDTGITSALKHDWDEFVFRVTAHEMRHLSHVTRHAPTMRTLLKQAQRQEGYLSAIQANRVAHKVIKEIQAMDRTYDKETKNGKTEGCWDIHVTPPG